MKQMLLAILIGLSSLEFGSIRSEATVYLSNLDNPWPPGTIGDIQALFPGEGGFTARFSTGAGFYDLNAATLEFLSYYDQPAGRWGNVDVAIYQQAGGSESLLGNLVNRVVNPTPTQWPYGSSVAYTVYVDFQPSDPIVLEPFTEYSIVAYVPAAKASGAGLLFTRSADYYTPADWQMGPTSTGTPYGAGEFMKLAIYATPVPECSTSLLVVFGAVLLGLVRPRRLRG